MSNVYKQLKNIQKVFNKKYFTTSRKGIKSENFKSLRLF